jgi:hypothetical protein
LKEVPWIIMIIMGLNLSWVSIHVRLHFLKWLQSYIVFVWFAREVTIFKIGECYCIDTLHYIALGGSSFSHDDCKNRNMSYKYMEKVSLCITVVNFITAIGLILSIAFLCPVLKIV